MALNNGIFFNFLNCSAIFLEFYITRLDGTIIFIFSLSRPSPIYFGLKWSHNCIFLIFEFLCYFFGIFYFALGWNETKRQFLFSLFLCLFQPILAWNKAIMIFFNFLNFVAIFLEFSITRRVGTERNDNLYFFSFSAFPDQFWLQKTPLWYF